MIYVYVSILPVFSRLLLGLAKSNAKSTWIPTWRPIIHLLPAQTSFRASYIDFHSSALLFNCFNSDSTSPVPWIHSWLGKLQNSWLRQGLARLSHGAIRSIWSGVVQGKTILAIAAYSHIWVCLKIGYTPNYSHLVGIMIINHWV